MNETVSNKNDFCNLTFDACSFAAAANYVSFKFHSKHFHTQNPKRGFRHAVDAWTANPYFGAFLPCYHLDYHFAM